METSGFSRILPCHLSMLSLLQLFALLKCLGLYTASSPRISSCDELILSLPHKHMPTVAGTCLDSDNEMIFDAYNDRFKFLLEQAIPRFKIAMDEEQVKKISPQHAQGTSQSTCDVSLHRQID